MIKKPWWIPWTTFDYLFNAIYNLGFEHGRSSAKKVNSPPHDRKGEAVTGLEIMEREIEPPNPESRS